MKKQWIFVVVDWDTREAVYAAASEEEASEFADELWVSDPKKDYKVSKACMRIKEE